MTNRILCLYYLLNKKISGAGFVEGLMIIKDIVLKSDILIVSKVKKNTIAKLFKDLKPGDKIELSINVEHVGSRRGKTYAPYILVTNIENGKSVHKSFNQLPMLLDAFDFEKD